ncbi:hypothetical protein GGF46_002143 [Coemansia sp. RSA 552]|nr:hypothetical protein GGF46_002143 [Coemansia sp. RSA 552]
MKEDWASGEDSSVRDALHSADLRAHLVRHRCRRRRSNAYAAAERTRAFAQQMRLGCGRPDCAVRFCRSNTRFTAALQRMDTGAREVAALELAHRAAEWPERAELQPHAAEALLPPPPSQEDSGRDVSRAGFVSAFGTHVRRLLAAERGRPEKAGGKPMDDVAVARLDSHTAPAVVAAGGRVLQATLELVMSSAHVLAQRSFAAADGSVDVGAAARFFELVFGYDGQPRNCALARRLAQTLRRTLAALEGMEDKGGMARALEVAALFAAVGALDTDGGACADAAALRRMIVRLVVRQTWGGRSDSERAPEFARDSAARQQWVRWWARVPAPVVRRWIVALQAAAEFECGSSLVLPSDPESPADALDSTGALEILRMAHEAAAQRRDIPRSEFASARLVAQLDTRRDPHGLSRVLMFPFLFNVRALARREAYERMRARYLGAHARQAELLQAQRMLCVDTHAEQAVRAGASPAWPLLAAQRGAVAQATSPYLVLAVRRAQLVPDSVDLLQHAPRLWRHPVKARFVAGGEDGVDMGGVLKELFAHLLPSLLAPERGLFSDDVASGLWPNPAGPHALRDFETAGALMGLAFTNDIVVHLPLAPLLAVQLAHNFCAPTDLDALLYRVEPSFPELVAGLRRLLEWDECNDLARVEDVFCSTFEVSVPDPLWVWRRALPAGDYLAPPFGNLPVPRIEGGCAVFPLVPGGGSIDVTAANRSEYVRLYINFLAFEHVRAQVDALRRGFASTAGGATYNMLSADELSVLLCPPDQPLDALELERAADYDEYSPDHPVVRRFWRVVRTFSQHQLRRLLMFVTATDHLPLGRYVAITFVVQRNGPDSERLPTALTCFGRLLLPAYETEERLRSCLLMAIENADGFGLV